MVCGLFFRSEANFNSGDQYLFQFMRLSGLPGWDIVYLKSGNYYATVTGHVKFASAIKMDNGGTNKFVLIAEGNKFTLYINDTRIGAFPDYSNYRMDGRFAFAAWEEAGTSWCEFDNSWVWLLK